MRSLTSENKLELSRESGTNTESKGIATALAMKAGRNLQPFTLPGAVKLMPTRRLRGIEVSRKLLNDLSHENEKFRYLSLSGSPHSTVLIVLKFSRLLMVLMNRSLPNPL